MYLQPYQGRNWSCAIQFVCVLVESRAGWFEVHGRAVPRTNLVMRKRIVTETVAIANQLGFEFALSDCSYSK